MSYYHKTTPESALRRAEDLIKIQKSEEAWDVLNNLLHARRYQTWIPSIETLMCLYIELCVKLRKNIRSGLTHYRSICQQQHFSYFEKAVRFLIQTAEAEVNKAAQEITDESEAEAKNLEQVSKLIDEDLGFSPSEQIYFVSAVGGEDADERSKRKILSPRLKYLWDSYRSVLDVLKNNAMMDNLYHDVVRSALAYCRNFERVGDFKKLCDLLRSHFSNIEKYQSSANSVDLSVPEVVIAHCTTKFLLMELACDFKVWNEALYIIEDIHNLLARTDTMGVYDMISPSVLAKFFEKLVQFFWASENYVFHAHAWRALYVQYRALEESSEASSVENLNEKIQFAASNSVLSALITPIDLNESSSEDAQEDYIFALKSLLSMKTVTRSEIIDKLLCDGLLDASFPEIKSIFEEIQNSPSPYTLFSKIQLSMDKLSSDFGNYRPLLNDVIIRQLLSRLSASYDTIGIDNFVKMVPSVDPGYLERLIVDQSSALGISVKINHKENQLSLMTRRNQDIELTNQLVNLRSSLQSLTPLIRPETLESKALERSSVFNLIRDGLEDDRSIILQRAKVVAARREIQKAEKIAYEKKQLEEKKLRLAREAEKKKQESIRLEKEQERIAELQGSSAVTVESSSVSVEDKKSAVVDPEEEERLKKKKEQEYEKRRDYFIRAQRIEEIPKLEDFAVKQKVEDEKRLLSQFERLKEESRAAFEHRIAEKERLRRMREQSGKFYSRIIEKRQVEFDLARSKQLERLTQLKKAKEIELKLKEEEEAERKRQEESRRKELELQEREARLHEEKEREAREKRLAEQREMAEYAERTAAKQREREAELERKRLAASAEPVRRAFRPAVLKAKTAADGDRSWMKSRAAPESRVDDDRSADRKLEERSWRRG